MIEILKFKSVSKNSLQGFLDIKVPKWGGFIIREIGYFRKGDQRWISFPSRVYEKDGEKKYHNYNLFEDAKVMQEFQKKVIEALDAYALTYPTCEKDPEPQPEFFF